MTARFQSDSRSLLSALLVCLVASTASSRQTPTAPHPIPTASTATATDRAALGMHIEATKTFFDSFTLETHVPVRGEFETASEYYKRLPKPWDTNRVIYIKVMPSWEWYKYDINTQKLTVFAGDLYTSAPTSPVGHLL